MMRLSMMSVSRTSLLFLLSTGLALLEKTNVPSFPHSLYMPFHIGEAEILKDGDEIAIIALGNSVYPAVFAAERLYKDGVSAMVVNARFAKPLDCNLLISTASRIKKIITVEHNTLSGGFGSAVLEFLNDAEIQHVQVRLLA